MMIGYQLTINASRHPQATAIVFADRRLDYRTLNNRACQAAQALLAEGIKQGDRVATVARNSDAFIVLFFAAAKIGAVFVPINFRLTAPEIGRIIAKSGPKLLFCGNSMLPVTERLRDAGMLPKIVVVTDAAETIKIDDTPIFDGWLSPFPTDEPDIAVEANDPQLLLHSSGTTGLPKGAVWTHATTLASCSAKIIDFDLGSDDATTVFGPLFHAGPLMDLAIPLLLRGGKLVIGASTGFDPEVVLRTAAAERATVMTIYPTMWRRVLTLPSVEQFDLASLRLLLTGGEPIPLPVLREVYHRFPQAGFVNTYGSTEGGPITTFLPPRDAQRKIGSVGMPAFSVEVRIADGEDRPLPRGEVGELLVRSPFVCRGYWQLPEETASSLRDGWWHTGDFARVDEDGFIWIEGRKKDMIISGAENIYPVEVEQAIATLAGVAEVAVIGVPDAEWGEAVMAYIVREPGAALGAAQIVEHCRRCLASYKKPRHISFVEALPRTTVNKVAKTVLREWFAASGGQAGIRQDKSNGAQGS